MMTNTVARGRNALAVIVECSTEVAISLIAVRFEYQLQND